MGQLSAAGYKRDTLAEIKTEIRDRLKASFGSGISVGEGLTAELEEFVSIAADLLDKREQELERLYSSRYVSTATGESLNQAVRGAGIQKLLAAPSKSDITPGQRSIATGTPTTPIPDGSRLEIVASGQRVKTVGSIVIGGGGTVELDVVALNNGPVVWETGDSVSGGELTFIDTIVGWDDFSMGDLVIGRDDETDEGLRLRHSESLQSTEGSTVDSIIARILTVSGIDSVFVIENVGPFTDSEGRPANTFEVVVSGGADQDIFDALLAAKATGIGLVGDVTGTANDKNGKPHNVAFSRPVDTNMFLEVTIEVNNLFPANGIVQIQDECVDFGTTEFSSKSGPKIIWDKFCLPVFNVDGIEDVKIKGGLSAGSVSETNLQLTFKQKPVFLQANIDVIIAAGP